MEVLKNVDSWIQKYTSDEYTILKSDLINNMDHMRIFRNEPSSVILSQTKWIQKLKLIARKCQNKLKPKGMV